MNSIDKTKLVSGITCITDIFNDTGDSPWIEGWICGYTDYDACDNKTSNNDKIHDALFEHLMKLRNQ